MMKRNEPLPRAELRMLLLTVLCCLLPMLAGLMLWDSLPAELPIHWNYAGEVDNYASKAFTVIGLPVLMAAFQAVLYLATRSDPRRDKTPPVVTQICLWIIPLLTGLLYGLTLAAGMGRDVPIEVILPMLIGMLFIAIGNYLPKCGRNYTVGIKTPWSLASDENWRRTHRVGGFCFVLGGALLLLAAVPGLWWLFFPAIGICALVPFLYSYLLYRRGI